MITITTTSDQRDVQALRDYLGSQRRGSTLHIPDILTGEMIHVRGLNFEGLETWRIAGDPGVTTTENRQRYLLDDFTEEPVNREKLYEVTWRDDEWKEHTNRLTLHSFNKLIEKIEEDESESEILEDSIYAEREPMIPTMWTFARK